MKYDFLVDSLVAEEWGKKKDELEEKKKKERDFVYEIRFLWLMVLQRRGGKDENI
jgi:hypothetical protein